MAVGGYPFDGGISPLSFPLTDGPTPLPVYSVCGIPYHPSKDHAHASASIWAGLSVQDGQCSWVVDGRSAGARSMPFILWRAGSLSWFCCDPSTRFPLHPFYGLVPCSKSVQIDFLPMLFSMLKSNGESAGKPSTAPSAIYV
jgi:hypothetical protein